MVSEMKRAPPPRGEAPRRSRSDGVDVELGAAAAQQRTAADQAGAGAEDQDDLATGKGQLTTLRSRSLQACQVILENAPDVGVRFVERVVRDVPQGGADLRGRPVAVDVAVLGVPDDRVDGRLRDRSLSDHGEHEKEQHGDRDSAQKFGLHIFTPPHYTYGSFPVLALLLPRACDYCYR